MEMYMENHQINISKIIDALKVSNPDISPRYERKFRIPKNIENVIEYRLGSVGFMEVFNKRLINSCYYDSHELNFANDNILGVNKRLKIRSRWYEKKKFNEEHSNLEIKCKDGFLGYKYIKKFNDKNITFFDNLSLKKVVQTSYERKYFKNIFGIRATLDTNIKAILPDNEKYFSPLNYSVLEVKYSISNDEYFRKYIQPALYSSIPIRLNKSSKYVEALVSLGII